MILIQDLRRQSEVDLVFGPNVPREFRHPLEKRTDDLVLGRLWTRALQPLDFPLDFCLLLLVELQLLDPFPKFLDVVPFVFVSQLTLDLLKLFAKKHLPLSLAQLLLHPCLDFLLSIEPRQLALYGDEGLTHALLVVEHLQERLLVLRCEFQVERNEIRERSRLIHTLDQLIERFRRNSPPGAQLGGALPQFMIERLKSRIVLVRTRLALHLEENRVQHPLTLGLVGDRLCSPLALYQQLNAAPDPVCLNDPDDCPDRVKHVGRWVVDVLLLRHGEEPTVSFERLLHGFHRARPARRDRHCHPGIDDGIPQRQHWKCISITHESSLKPIPS